MTITVDIRARVFGSDERAYRLFPGAKYKFFDVMHEESMIFLDTPYLPNPPRGGYTANESFLDAIRFSEEATKAFHPGAPSIGSNGIPAPIERPDSGASYSPRPLAEIPVDSDPVGLNRAREQMLRWLNILHHDTQIGDIVVVPSPGYVKESSGPYAEVQSLVGEVVGRTERWYSPSKSKFYPRDYPARRVKWLTSINEFELHKTTTKLLRTQNAIIGLRKNELPFVLTSAYDNVVMGDECFAKFSTTSKSFDVSQSFQFQAFCMVVAGAVLDSEKQLGLFQGKNNLYEVAAIVAKMDEPVPEQTTTIRSPGHITLKSLTHLTPLVAAGLFVLAVTVGPDLFSEGIIQDFELVNTYGGGDEECTLQVKQSIDVSARSIGAQVWPSICEAAKAVQESNGLNTSSTIVH